MRSTGARREKVDRLWAEHMRAEFPAELRGRELAGVHMILLDADVAGCVTTWQSNRGVLDEERHRALLRCVTDLDKVLPLLTDDREALYYGRLRDLALTVLEHDS
ncbi:hypothetical protein AB0M72_02515 [Nocardiopsis dassonvillei]|uniref:hypothetical protein n=1 Tax=Nocardiopsis dassonvillei TaxID=2014 RepID=UPI00200FDF3F|nr:hypothetical protein [Nocardiopsis dassonvillei]MCK9869126.1 hypothetical protein [Nocardiopsis dassonvillei]